VSAGRAVYAKGKQREFLKHAKELSRLNWELFASHIGISSYNVLRATYLNERNTLPVAVLSKAAHLFKDATLCSQIVGFRPAHWGQSKGGSISLKKWHATMRKKPKSYHDLQSRRFLKARSYNYETSMAMKCGLYTSCWLPRISLPMGSHTGMNQLYAAETTLCFQISSQTPFSERSWSRFLVFALRGHGYGYWKNSGCTCRTKRQIEYWSFISNRIEKLR